MADQGGRPGNEQGAIRVQLSLLSAEDSTAARQLADSIGQIAKMFEAIKATNYIDAASKMAQLHAKMVADTERLQQQQQQTQGGPSNIEKVREFFRRGGSGRSPDEIGDDLTRTHAQQQRDEAAKKEEERRAKERDRLEGLSSGQHAADRRRRSAGYPGIGADDDDPTAFYNQVDELKGESTGLRIPQFGSLTAQDYLTLLRQSAVRRSLNEGPSLVGRLGLSQGSAQAIAPYLQRAGNVAGVGYALASGFRRLSSFAASQGLSPMGMEASGAALGYRRGGGQIDLPFLPGVQTPFSEAGAEGWRQSWDIQKLRWQAGINSQQAGQIVQASAQAGFSGNQRQDIANRFMAPLVRQFGLNPETLIPFTQVLRTGTASVGDLSRELSDLGEVARAARTDVNTMAQALSQSGEAAQQAGGYYMSGVQYGRTFATSTGLTPNVGSQLLQNPFVSAFLSGSTGLPSFAQAAAPATAKLAATRSAANMLYNAYAGAMGTRGARTPIGRDAQGGVLYDEGTNPAMAAAASQLGISSDELDRIRRGTDQSSRLTQLDTMLTAYGRRGQQLLTRTGADPSAMNRRGLAQVTEWNRSAGVSGAQYRWNSTKGVVEQKTLKGWIEADSWRTNQIAGHAVGGAQQHVMDTMKQGRKGVIDYQDLVHAAHGAGISGKTLGDALKGKDTEAQVKNVRRLISEKQAEEQAKYEIAFTGPAAKFFKALAKKTGLEQQYADLPSNVAAASSAGPSPLSNQSNSGLTGP